MASPGSSGERVERTGVEAWGAQVAVASVGVSGEGGEGASYSYQVHGVGVAVTIGVASPAAWAWHAGMPVVWAWVWKQAACARRAGAGREWRGDGVEGPRRAGTSLFRIRV